MLSTIDCAEKYLDGSQLLAGKRADGVPHPSGCGLRASRSAGTLPRGNDQTVMPSDAQRIAKAPPPAALNGAPKEVEERSRMLQPAFEVSTTAQEGFDESVVPVICNTEESVEGRLQPGSVCSVTWLLVKSFTPCDWTAVQQYGRVGRGGACVPQLPESAISAQRRHSATREGTNRCRSRLGEASWN